MLQELFLALLGFPGDILVECEDTIRVKEGFDLLTQAEKEQVNRISPLGWYYLRLTSFVEEYDIKWGGRAHGRPFQAYRSALSLGVSDLLGEYTADVAYLEQLVLSDGPIPLSQVLLHMQKYLLTLPAVYVICSQIETGNIRGCKILDYLTYYQSGVPVITHVVRHLLFHVRAVFLKQLLAWMVYGELDDPGGEFFIQIKSVNGAAGNDSLVGGVGGQSIQDEVRGRLGMAFLESESYLDAGGSGGGSSSGGSDGSDSLPFDWASSYILRLELLPESHVSPRMASKVLFAGKAARLLQSAASGLSGHQQGLSSSSASQGHGAYRYLSGGFGVGLGQGRADGKASQDHPHPHDSAAASSESKEGKASSASASTSTTSSNDPLDAVEAIFTAHAQSCGYEKRDLDSYAAQFMSILDSPEHALATLEQLVDEVNGTVSSKIWVVLRHRFGFLTFLNAIRNTYLMGKGELYQLILDGVSKQTFSAVVDTKRANVVLNWGVVRQAAKLLGLDDDDMCEVFRLRVNSHVVSITPLVNAGGASVAGSGGAGSGASTARIGSSSSRSLFDTNESDCGAVVAGSARMYRAGALSASGTGPRAALVTPPGSDPVHSLAMLWTQRSLHRAGDLAAARAGNLHEVFGEAIVGDEGVAARNRTWLPSPAAGPTKGSALLTSASTNSPSYAVGAVWMSDQKYLVKGFTFTSTFGCDLQCLQGVDIASLCGADSAGSTSGGADDVVDVGASIASLSTISLASSLPGLRSERGRWSDRGEKETSLLLGCVACTVHSDRQGPKTVPSAPFGMDIPASLCVGVSFHAAPASQANNNTAQYFARVFIAANQASSRFRSASMAAGNDDNTLNGTLGAAAAGLGSDMTVLAERFIPLDTNGQSNGRGLSAGGLYAIDIEYSRELSTSSGSNVIAGAVQYLMSARIRDIANANASTSASSNANTSTKLSWDVSTLVDVSHYVKLQGGQGTVGLTGSGIVVPLSNPLDASTTTTTSVRFFSTDIYSLTLRCKGALSTYPVASPQTSTRHPDTFIRLESELGQIRAWLQLHLSFRFPPVFGIVFDAEALGGYERLFSFIMKIRLVAHCLERLWKARSRLSSDRQFCMIRHSMHFFCSNLLYYLQVDCVDSEFGALLREIETASDFQVVLRAHRNFLATILRVSLVDHLTIQEGIERVLQACLRFIAVCRLLQQQEGADDEGTDVPDDSSLPSLLSANLSSPGSQIRARVQRLPVVVPPEELDAIRKEFFSQIAFLFSVARKIENRGFMFRLDFNGYLSGLMDGP